MQDNLDVAYFGKNQVLVVGAQGDPTIPLRVGQAVIPSSPFEARIARRFSGVHATKEGVHRFLQTQDDILHHLRVDRSQ